MGRHEGSSAGRAGRHGGGSAGAGRSRGQGPAESAGSRAQGPAGSGADPPDRPGAPAPEAGHARPGSSDQPPDVPLREELRPPGPPRLDLSVDHQQDRVVAHLEGELDILTAPTFSARIDEVIRASAGDVTLDLRAVRFIDSAGLQLLLNTRRRLVRGGRTLSVICGDGPVMRLIELTRLTETLRVTNL